MGELIHHPWTMFVQLIHKKRRQRNYHSDIENHVTRNIIFSVLHTSDEHGGVNVLKS